MTRLAVALGAVTAALALVAPAAAADECRGLQTCLPVAGPWVVVPAPTGVGPVTTVWELRCPLPNYIVGGIDARVSDRALDVAIRGESGSPVSPGVTTGRSVLFVATYAGTARKPTAFAPFVGCIPATGGGGRSQTSVRRVAAYAPGRPVVRRVVTRPVAAGAPRPVTVRCPAGSRLLAADHSVGVRVAGEPPARLLRAVRARRAVAGRAVTATAAVDAAVPRALRVELQVHAICTRAGG